MVNLIIFVSALCLLFPHQLAPKPVQTQVASSGQQQRLIVPALPSTLPQIATTGASGSLQFPHGVISGGVVYLPQVCDTERLVHTDNCLPHLRY